ncbi:MAG TPA: hypothetical protein PLJ47_07095 [Candidatus Hydrogenedentes bacterium]|nr:hypothetical protein [Candidatus Hydrogenedentota bacterium]HRK34345.1 hypothetical protein [Candidatus Hydrogenedentota bacterium]
MKHVKRISSLPAYAFGEMRPNPFLKGFGILLQGVLVLLGNKEKEA